MKRIALAGALLALAVPTTAFAQEAPPTPKESAAKACKAERAQMGEETFAQTYGTNKNRKNAFGKCVSSKKDDAAEAQENASKTCKAERESLGDEAFREKYGTNKNKRNAHGKCVSAQTKAELAEETEDNVEAAKTCKAERESLGAEAFREKYGTNKNKRNAFGKCVSAQAKAQQDAEEEEEETTTPPPTES